MEKTYKPKSQYDLALKIKQLHWKIPLTITLITSLVNFSSDVSFPIQKVSYTCSFLEMQGELNSFCLGKRKYYYFPREIEEYE